jgi:hypothetical protein
MTRTAAPNPVLRSNYEPDERADHNPHWMPETHTQFLQKLNVQTGIIGIGDRILEQVFLDSNLDGALAALFPNPLDPDLPPERIWRTPPHYAVIVRRYLDKVFPNRWIGRRGKLNGRQDLRILLPSTFFMGIFQK